jgi:hypothetical protein
MTGPIKPGGSPLAISEINTGFALGDNLGVYRGVTWYYSGNLDTGTFPSGTTARLDIANFYGKQPTDPATSGTTTINTVGSGTFKIPLYRNTLIIEIWGGGGGGGSGCHDGTFNGSSGSSSSVLGVTTGGGGGGVGGDRYGAQNGAGGSGGTASGSATPSPTTLIKTSGNAGSGGSAGGNRGGAGGAAPNGGTAGAAGNNGPGGVGGAPGAGGGGGGYSDHQSKNPNQAAGGGGGSGAYANIYYSSYGAITSGTVISYTVGAGGSGAPQDQAGGNGASGRIKFTWT